MNEMRPLPSEPAVVAIPRRREEIRRRIEARRAEITIAQQEIDALLTEDGELDTAERVIARLCAPLGGRADAEIASSPWDDPDESNDVEGTDGADGKTVPAMIIAAVHVKYAQEHRGITGVEIFSTIRRLWRPEIQSNRVRPVIWRLVNERRIRKKGKFYYPRPEQKSVGGNPLTDPPDKDDSGQS